MDLIEKYFKDNPAAYGLLAVLVGLFFVLASVFDWNWIFGDINPVNYDLNKIDGMVNFLGRGPARVIVGAGGFVSVILGMLVIGLCLKKQKR